MDVSVSVIIPCYNVEKYIREAVESVFNQTGLELELICVDDCSTDRTVEILNELKTTHPDRFFIFRNESNRGAAYSRNKGIETARGNYIQFLDADDLILSGKIVHQLNLCKQQNRFPEIIVADYIRKNNSGEEKLIVAQTKDPWFGLMQTRLGCTCSNLWKKESLEAVDGFDISLKSSQEYNLMFRLLKNGSDLIYDDQPLTLVRERGEGSISGLDRGANWKRFVQLRCDVIAFMKSSGKLTAENQDSFYQVLFDSIRSWYPFAPKEAFETFHKYIPRDFKPKTSAVSSGNYIRLYRIFGFRMAERIKKLTKGK